MITVQGDEVHAETATLAAVIRRGWITSLKDKATGEEWIRPFDPAEESAVQLLYHGGEAVSLDGQVAGGVSARRLNDHRAEVLFRSWDGDGRLLISEDPETGELLIEPSACSTRPGVLACRWTLRGIREDLDLVAPLWQGVKLPVGDPINRGARRPWPMHWEAGLVILQGAEGGLWVHCRDTAYRYKALKFGIGGDAQALSFDTEAYGPAEDKLAAGGLTWRVGVHRGGWQVPARRYRDWLWRAWGLEDAAACRAEWLAGLTLALCWCPGDPEILDAVARKVEPGRVLIHYPRWRTDGYDQNYPTYTPSDEARAFVARAHEMGFHVAPHFNSLEIDPSNPAHHLLGEFKYRDLRTGRAHGWAHGEGRILSVPESGLARGTNRERNVMVKIHPGLAMWRSVLGEAVRQAAEELSLEAAFIDVTLCTGNLRNCFVEGMTSTEGIKRLIEEIGRLGGGLAVGG
jgi:hypothetical protein